MLRLDCFGHSAEQASLCADIGGSALVNCPESDVPRMDTRSNDVGSGMTAQVIAPQGIRRALVWGALLAGLWVVVALIRPTPTFHLAPFLIAAAPPVLSTLDGDTRADRTTAVGLAAASIALALAAALVVDVTGAMQGPAFEGFSGPLVEAAVFAAIGTAAGIGFAWWSMG